MTRVTIHPCDTTASRAVLAFGRKARRDTVVIDEPSTHARRLGDFAGPGHDVVTVDGR